MSSRVFLSLATLACSAPLPPGNSIAKTDVIVLVHGFFGWGPGELFNFHYWGGLYSIEKELQAEGYDVRTAVVGPVSSNWDRAVELYAFLKGGRVDYGAQHAAMFNHSRYGRTFPGIYPEWGTEDSQGRLRRVHFIGHSMGGQTVRMLLRFLAEGSAEERKIAGSSPLFDGGRASWVRSISTVNAPHDGTTLTGKALPGSFVNNVAWPLFKGICAIQGLFGDELPYDFKLDQFGLERNDKEGFLAYSDRVMASSIWDDNFIDFSSYDLGVAGARAMNVLTPAQPDVYYFSYSSCDTRKTLNPLSKHQVAKLLMWEFLKPFADLMGWTGEETWWPSDGVVNTISETGPKLGSKDVIVPFVNGTKISQLKPGVWNYMGAQTDKDHLEMVGMGVQRVAGFYLDIAATLSLLPDQRIAPADGDVLAHWIV